MTTIEQLQSLADQIPLSGQMPRPILRMMKGCRYESFSKKRGSVAHSHAGLRLEHRGWICFTEDALDIPTLAHELAHLRYPKARHNARRFKEAAKDYFGRLCFLYP